MFKLEYLKEGPIPDFTFIIPTYNRVDLLIRSLKSILKLNSNINHEIIIVDNNSEENDKLKTIDYLNNSTWSAKISVKYYYNYENTGMYQNWNNGVRFCNSKYFTILNDDDILLPGFNKLISYSLLKQPTEVICGTISYWDGQSILNLKRNLIPSKKILFCILSFLNYYTKYSLARGFKGNPIPGTLGAIFNKDIFDQLGFYNEEFGLAADYDFNSRCLSTIGIKRFFTSVALYYVNNNTSSTITTTRRFLGESKIIRFKILKNMKFERNIIHFLRLKQSIFLYEHVKMFNIKSNEYVILVTEFNLFKLNSFKYYFSNAIILGILMISKIPFIKNILFSKI